MQNLLSKAGPWIECSVQGKASILKILLHRVEGTRHTPTASKNDDFYQEIQQKH